MALLTVTAVTALSAATGTQVKVELTDSRGAPVIGFTTTGTMISAAVTKTNSLGVAVLDLTPNNLINPSNTYYTVTLGSKSFLIEKSGASQTLAQAIVGGILGEVGPTVTSDALLKANNLSDLTDVADARFNLELGAASTLNIGTIAGTVAAGDDPRFLDQTLHNDLTGRDDPSVHPADSIDFTPYLGIVDTNVQAAIQDVYDLAVQSLDEADEIIFAPTGTLTSVNVQDAIVEARLEAQPALDHIVDATAAHEASAINFDPTGTPFTTFNIQDAFEEIFILRASTPVNSTLASTAVDAISLRATGDPFPRVVFNAGGEIQWTDGGQVATSTLANLRLNTTNGIKTDSTFAIAGGTSDVTATAGDLRLRNAGTITARNNANGADIPVLTIDAADDVTIGVNTGDSIKLAVNGTARATVAAAATLSVITGSTVALKVGSDADGTTGTGGIQFGSSGDTNLYRSAANTLKTDDALVSAVSVTAPFAAWGTNPAQTGGARLANDAGVVFRNFANSVDITAFNVNTSNNTVVNATTGQSVQLHINGTVKFTIDATTITLADGMNYVIGQTTGTKFGSSGLAKIGLWGATAVVQPSSTGESVGRTAGAGGTVSSTDSFTGNLGTKSYTMHDIVKHLKTVGILASS